MIALPEILIGPAREAGMKVPKDVWKFDPNLFPHFAVYLNAQMGVPMPSPTSHWHNAKVIAQVPDDKIVNVTMDQLEEMGFEIGHAMP
jgi:hypothetical protein